MNLNSRQQAIITGAAADLNRLKHMQPRTDTHRNLEAIVENEEIEYAQHDIVRSNPAKWLDRNLTGSDYVLLGRAYKVLESHNLIRRHKLGDGGEKYTHLEITEAGRRLAKQLATAATT